MSGLTRTELLARFRALSVWRKGDRRAPHKPLLVLHALGELERLPGIRLHAFDDLEGPLARLLAEFGPPSRSVHPEYPFWHLRSDEVWEVPGAEEYATRKGGSSPPKSELRARHARGGFTPEAFELLRSDRGLRRRVAEEILRRHFPASLHAELLDAVGLDLDVSARQRQRSAGFRREVLRAYGRACAVCGLDVRLESGAFGLDAAHIRWKEAGGPDEVPNGLALCVLHHRAFDRGVFTLDAEHRVLVSADLHGSAGLDRLFLDHHMKPVREPHARDLLPHEEHVSWHREQVFRAPPR